MHFSITFIKSLDMYEDLLSRIIFFSIAHLHVHGLKYLENLLSYPVRQDYLGIREFVLKKNWLTLKLSNQCYLRCLEG